MWQCLMNSIFMWEKKSLNFFYVYSQLHVFHIILHSTRKKNSDFKNTEKIRENKTVKLHIFFYSVEMLPLQRTEIMFKLNY